MFVINLYNYDHYCYYYLHDQSKQKHHKLQLPTTTYKNSFLQIVSKITNRALSSHDQRPRIYNDILYDTTSSFLPLLLHLLLTLSYFLPFPMSFFHFSYLSSSITFSLPTFTPFPFPSSPLPFFRPFRLFPTICHWFHFPIVFYRSRYHYRNCHSTTSQNGLVNAQSTHTGSDSVLRNSGSGGG